MAGAERLGYVGGGKGVFQVGWIGLYQTVDEVDLLQGVVDYLMVDFVGEISARLWAVSMQHWVSDAYSSLFWEVEITYHSTYTLQNCPRR